MSRRVLVGLATVVGALSAAPAASAFTTSPVWQCRASPLYASVAGNNRVEPIVANGNINTANGASPDRAQCVKSETGAGNLATQLGIPQNFLGAGTASALTDIDPELGRAIDQTSKGVATVENLSLQLPAGGVITLGVKAATATATGTCTPNSTTPVLSGTSNVATVTLGGVPLNLDGLLGAVNQLLQPLSAVAQIKINEQVRTSTSLTQRALHVIVLPRAGGAPLVDLVVGEAKVAFNGPVCDPTQQNDGGSGVCPPGSVLDAARNVCVIKSGTSGSSLGDIVVGRPYQSPSGGTVIPIDVARRLYGRSACLAGNGAPKFAIVGTNRADRITGTNGADRIIGLGGNDKLDGGRGNDCIEGRSGSDTMSGGLGDDRVYGSTGKDHLNGGPGSDRLSGGDGDDTFNAAFGRDRVLAGAGRDFVNIATAGPAASADCGPGSDVARINRNETKRISNCERVYIFRDR